MSAVERVREAARLTRERAQAVESYAGEERWRHGEIGWDDPEVARRIADWLEQAAALVDEAGDGPLAIVAAALTEPAVALADAYLGAES